MATTWDGYTVICGGKNGCGSEDIEYLRDENVGSLEDYEIFICKNCGRIVRIELPN